MTRNFLTRKVADGAGLWFTVREPMIVTSLQKLTLAKTSKSVLRL